MKTISDTSLFHAYNYYQTKAEQISKAKLTPEEKAFYEFCIENHTEICDYTLPENLKEQATILYDNCI